MASQPLFVLGTYRDVELDVTRPFARVLEALVRERHASRLTLRRLPASGVRDMLEAMSGREAPPSLARVIFEVAGFTTPLVATTVAEFPSPVRRPIYSVLDNAALRAAGLDRMRHWRDALCDYLGRRMKASNESVPSARAT